MAPAMTIAGAMDGEQKLRLVLAGDSDQRLISELGERRASPRQSSTTARRSPEPAQHTPHTTSSASKRAAFTSAFAGRNMRASD
jgi:hypothetical protein